MVSARKPFEIGGSLVRPGETTRVPLPLGGLYTHTPIDMPVYVVHGKGDGPVLFVSAAVHGDEVNGIEVIRRLLRTSGLKRLRGTLVAVPVVNVFGFNNNARYLPDRRDLNRSFPGRDTGSMASQMADTFLSQVVMRADVGIDLHTAAVHRDNLPQIRADLLDVVLAPLARKFAAPVLLHSAAPAGSLRFAAAASGIPVMVYEAGEALRFDETAIRVGLRGVLNVMRALNMLPGSKRPPANPSAVLSRSTVWLRAPQSGIMRARSRLGDLVRKGDVLGVVDEPSGDAEMPLNAPFDGVIIGRTNLPLVYQGEALFHLGRTRELSLIGKHLEAMQGDDQLGPPELIEEPRIV